jgi:glycosyltransferase involved in cell wall biosynthesis
MRIGMILDRPFPPDDRVKKEAQSLIKAGHEVHLLCFRHNKNEKIYEIIGGIKVHRVFMPHRLYKKLSALILLLPFYGQFWYKHIKQFVLREKIEILHIHDLPLVGVGLKIKKEYGLPVVADMHENYPVFISEIKYANTFLGKTLINKDKWFKKEKEWLSQVDHIVVVVDGMKKRLESILSSEKEIIVTPNSPVIGDIVEHQIEIRALSKRFNDKFVVFYFGGLDSRRGLDTLISAVPLLKEKINNLVIVIVGSGSYLAELKRKIDNNNLSEIFIFEGWHPTSHLQAYMQITDVSIIPHLKSIQTDNSSPNKLFLYMIFAKPIISTNCNSIQQIIENEKCGLIYDSGDHNALLQKILYIFKNPDEAKKMGLNGAKAVAKKYDWEVTVQDLVNMYSKINNDN